MCSTQRDGDSRSLQEAAVKRWIPSARCFSLPFPRPVSLRGFGAAQPSGQSWAGSGRSQGLVPTRRRGKSQGESGC